MARGIFSNIPNKASRVWLWPFLTKLYRERKRVERLIGKAKQFRRFATPPAREAVEMFLGVVHLIFCFIRL
jgi:hypothetical protein